MALNMSRQDRRSRNQSPRTVLSGGSYAAVSLPLPRAPFSSALRLRTRSQAINRRTLGVRVNPSAELHTLRLILPS